ATRAIALAVQVLALLGELDEARALWAARRAPCASPPARVRNDLELASAATALGHDDEARALLEQALTVAVAHGYRWYELVAHDRLAALAPEDARAEHATRARLLARSLASGLASQDADAFLARGWGDLT